MSDRLRERLRSLEGLLGLSKGAIVRGRVVQGIGDWLLVGGTGGLRTPLDAKPYRSATLDDVLADVLAEVGERLSSESSALFGFNAAACR